MKSIILVFILIENDYNPKAKEISSRLIKEYILCQFQDSITKL